MDNVVNLKTNNNGQNSELVIHPEKAAAIGLGNRKFAYLSFGNLKHYVVIRIDNEICPENILLSPNLIKKLFLPEYPVYELAVNLNEIVIGPYIGILTSNEDRRLTTSRLNKMLVYVKEYPKLHGTIIVFTLDKVDKEKRLIEGYCYNPVKKCWQKATLPYPAAIYRTIGLSTEWKNHFLTVAGDKIFNNRFFSKWETFQWFSKEPGINPHIPYTILYLSPADVFEMLAKFPKIYLKPNLGLQGRGITRVSIENKLFIFKYRENGENCSIIFEDSGKAAKYIAEHFRPGRYLVQQAIDLLEYKGRIIDFRCIVQKNQAGLWICQAIIGRSGVKDSIVSNISSGGTAFTAEYLLKKAVTGSTVNTSDLQKKITAFALTVCRKLDQYGINCGTLGLDIGLDIQGHLWLIEINNRDPDPSIAMNIHDIQLYYTLKTGPLLYAKYLAGFKEEL